jgi:Flp pilus assembly protein TadG
MEAKPRVRSRRRSRGVATIELALSMTFLVPLLLAVVDFGYYFYIGSVAEDAAHAGVRAAVRQSAGGTCALTQVAVIATGTAPATGSPPYGTTCLGGAASCVMNEPPLRMGAALGPTTVTLTCAAVPVNPTWSITVQVDFPPSVGFFRAWMPAGGSGRVRYTARLTGS